MKNCKKSLALFMMSLVLCMGIAMTSFAKVPDQETLEEIYNDVGFAMMCSGAKGYESGEQAPDKFVFWYMQIGGFMQDYYDQDSMNIIINYDEYIKIVDDNIMVHSDMKAYLTEKGYYDAETNMITWFAGGFGGPYMWFPTTVSAYGDGEYTVTGLSIELLWEGTAEGLKEYYDYILIDNEIWLIDEVQQVEILQVGENLKVNGFKLVDSYAMDGNYYTMNSDVVAHQLHFSLGSNVTFEGTVAGGGATRETVVIRQLDGTDQYYLWPDSTSSLMFSVPDGVTIKELSLSPEGAGTMELVAGTNIVNVSLNQEATLTVLTDAPVLGDSNGDGKINGKDSIMLNRYLAGWDVEIGLEAADINGDGKVNGKDVILLDRYLAGWTDEL